MRLAVRRVQYGFEQRAPGGCAGTVGGQVAAEQVPRLIRSNNMRLPFLRRGQVADPPKWRNGPATPTNWWPKPLPTPQNPHHRRERWRWWKSCTSLIATPLMVASVTGYALSGGTLLAMGRDLLLRGNSVWLIDILPNGQVQLLRASGFEVGGRSSNPAR